MARTSEEKITATKKRKNVSSFPLEDLPDEIILTIFSFLDKKDLNLASLVSKRTYNISQDCSLWLKINFYKKKLTTALLEKVLINGCKYLSLQHARLEGNIRLKKPTSLKSLDISNCDANQGVLDEILASCYSLEKLCLIDFNLESININDMTALNGQTLQVLNMINCRGLNLDRIKPLIDNCVQLKELNVRDRANSKTIFPHITKEAVDYLIKNLTPNIEQLSLGNLDYLIGDNEIKILVGRCKNLNSLYLRKTNIGNDSMMAIVNHLKDTLVNLSVEETYISSFSLRELKSISKLKILKCNGKDTDDLDHLRKLLPNVAINVKGAYFTIASSAIQTV